MIGCDRYFLRLPVAKDDRMPAAPVCGRRSGRLAFWNNPAPR